MTLSGVPYYRADDPAIVRALAIAKTVDEQATHGSWMGRPFAAAIIRESKKAVRFATNGRATDVNSSTIIKRLVPSGRGPDFEPENVFEVETPLISGRPIDETK